MAITLGMDLVLATVPAVDLEMGWVLVMDTGKAMATVMATVAFLAMDMVMGMVMGMDVDRVMAMDTVLTSKDKTTISIMNSSLSQMR